MSFLPSFSSISSSLPGNRSSLARRPGDVVLINSADCTLIKLPVNGPAPGSPPRVQQDGSLCKQLQIYGTAVAVAMPSWPCNKERGTIEGVEKKYPPRYAATFICKGVLFVIAVVCFPSLTFDVICIHYSETAQFLSFFFFLIVFGNTDVLLTQQFKQVENNFYLFMWLALTGYKHLPA